MTAPAPAVNRYSLGSGLTDQSQKILNQSIAITASGAVGSVPLLMEVDMLFDD